MARGSSLPRDRRWLSPPHGAVTSRLHLLSWRRPCGEDRMHRRRLTIAAAVLAVAAGLVVALSFLIDEPLRRRVEAAVNASLVGYKAHIGTLRFHPLGGSLDLDDATL